ncbi:MAG: flagella synthesis protein FlgN [Paraglaciecola sp.]|jgi:flagella synthesis protein FlgN
MSELISAITIQFDHLENLKLALESELHLISCRNAESLITLLKNKEALLETIQVQDNLIATAYNASTEIERNTEEVQSLFDHAQSLISQCAYRTKINQTAVEQGQLRLGHLRTLLLEARAKESMTYDKTGKAQGGKKIRGVSV